MTRRPTPTPRFRAHPLFFSIVLLLATAELGLTIFLINAGNESGQWTSPRYHAMLKMFLFNAVWTTLYASVYVLWLLDGASHILASIASSLIWLFITSALWAVASGVMRITRHGGNCAGQPTISRCRQSLTVEALGWAEFSMCLLTMLTTCLWMSQSKRSYRHSYYGDLHEGWRS